jgi:uncharacterized protein (DUF433 family)
VEQAPLIETIPLTRWDDGSIRVTGSRVTLDLIIMEFNEGFTPEQIIQDFRTLRLDDVYAIITYYLRHKNELDEYLQVRDQEEEAIFQEHEAESRELIERSRALMKDRAKGAAPRRG